MIKKKTHEQQCTVKFSHFHHNYRAAFETCNELLGNLNEVLKMAVVPHEPNTLWYYVQQRQRMYKTALLVHLMLTMKSMCYNSVA